jgi:hypothetical protein
MAVTTIKGAIAYLVLHDAAMISLIGDRFKPGLIPAKSPLPAIGYQVIGTTHENTQDGPDGLPARRFQFTVDANSWDDCEKVSKALRILLDGYHGKVGNIEVSIIRLENDYDGTPNLETGIITVRQDYKVCWKE